VNILIIVHLTVCTDLFSNRVAKNYFSASWIIKPWRKIQELNKMSENTTIAIIALVGTVCTSLITAILGPILINYLKPSSSPKPEGSSTTQIRYVPIPPQVSTLATVSLILGLISLCGWFIPLCGFPISMFGFLTGMASTNSANRGSAISGIVLSILGFIASCIWFVLNYYYLYTTGQYNL
jgi:hypothetical protein